MAEKNFLLKIFSKNGTKGKYNAQYGNVGEFAYIGESLATATYLISPCYSNGAYLIYYFIYN
jgi:hypothetical protein